jgi:hypothetical protein
MPASAAPRSGLIRYMDNVLLCLLERRPQLAPRVFAAMFSGCAPRAFVRIRFGRDRGGDAAGADAQLAKGQSQ